LATCSDCLIQTTGNAPTIINGAQTFALTWFTLIFAVAIADTLCKIVSTSPERLAGHRLPVSLAKRPFAAQSASSISGSTSAAVMGGGSGVFVPTMIVVRKSSVATVTSRRGISGGRRTSEVKSGSSNQRARYVFMGSIPARSTI
jgi:hypothetical protein